MRTRAIDTAMTAEELAAFLDWSEQHLIAATRDMHPEHVDKIAKVIKMLRLVQDDLAADAKDDT